MSNWSSWSADVKVVDRYIDDTTPKEDLKTLEDIFVPLGAALAATASRSQLYHDLAECQTDGHCTVLKYNKQDHKFEYERDGKPRSLDPNLFIERGFKVCKSSRTGDVYIRNGKPVEGMLAVSYEDVHCDPGDEYLGTVHLHPAGAVFPSGQDMLMSILGKYNCIAGKVYDPKEKKEYGRVLCMVTDDVYLVPDGDSPDLNMREVALEYPEVLELKVRYDSEVQGMLSRYRFFTLTVEDADGNVFTYIFPPRSKPVLYELVNKAKEVFRDTHRFELYTVDLSDSRLPDLKSLER